MEFFNMDPKLIRHGGRKAPTGTTQQLADVLDAGLPPLPDSIRNRDDGRFLASIPVVDVLDERFSQVGDIIGMEGLGKVGSDLSRINECLAFEFEELGVAANGIPYLFCRCTVEDSQPFAVVIYCDGKTLRGYLPHYGNMLDYPGFWPVSCPEMFCYPTDKRPVYIQKKGGSVEERQFASNEELWAYIESSCRFVAYSKDACLMDFSSRVEPTGSMTEEVVVVARNNVAKTYEKYLQQRII